MTAVEADARLASAVVPPPISTILKPKDSPPSQALSCLPLPEGYVVAPFCPDIRWQKKISDRKLSAGATAAVYRYVSSTCACQKNAPYPPSLLQQ